MNLLEDPSDDSEYEDLPKFPLQDRTRVYYNAHNKQIIFISFTNSHSMF